MNITIINAFAEGHYSGQTFSEDVIIPTEIYEKCKSEIDNMSMYICELDGKHSEVKANISVTNMTEEDLLNTNIDLSDSSDRLFEKLDFLLQNYDIFLYEEYKKAKDYIDTLDTYVDVTVTVRKSNVNKVSKFCEEL